MGEDEGEGGFLLFGPRLGSRRWGAPCDDGMVEPRVRNAAQRRRARAALQRFSVGFRQMCRQACRQECRWWQDGVPWLLAGGHRRPLSGSHWQAAGGRAAALSATWPLSRPALPCPAMPCHSMLCRAVPCSCALISWWDTATMRAGRLAGWQAGRQRARGQRSTAA